MTAPAIVAREVTIRFRPLLDKRPTLRRSVAHWGHKERETVVAVDGVTIEIGKGEAFGIIGSNGAGKSTLLKIFAKTMRPDEGTINVYGKTSTLLQLGLGFNPELSGRHNVYLGGLAAGLRKRRIDDLYDQIVEYAGLGKAIDRALKTYSSGMFARLAFSVGMAMEPNILLLDEVLAVGDEEFRVKSMAAMEDLLDKAGTIVFVSHSLPLVDDFCDRVMWMEEGRIRCVGSASEVIEQYRAWVKATKQGSVVPAGSRAAPA